MFGIGVPELILIVIVALVVVGPKRLPVTLRAIGRAIGEFRRATRELRNEVGFDNVVDEVTRPLREGMAGIESEARKIEQDVRRMDDDPAVLSGEYPVGGPDDYGALPETATSYPETAGGYPEATPVYSAAKARALEGTVAHGAADPDDEEPLDSNTNASASAAEASGDASASAGANTETSTGAGAPRTEG
jgi:Tat protein translocase TatB subunit